MAATEEAPAEPAPAEPGAHGPPAGADAPLQTPADRRAARAANADFSVLEQVEAIWQDVIRDVRPKSPAVQGLLRGVSPIDVEGNTIVLLATSSFHKDTLEKPQNRKIVEDVINKQLGGVFAIRCTIEGKTETRDLRGQIREARKDELVRAAMNIFEAHIIDIEPET
jgi:DNA polymerase-3 subunit gamma/tau